MYAALALGFRPPTTETLERLMSPDAAAALTDAARIIDSVTEMKDADPSLTTLAAALARPYIALDTLRAEHRHLFGHTARGEVPPYETEYGAEALFQQPQELSDLAGFMRAFGLVVRAEAHERVDHVSCECEFVSFLAWKEAYAITVGDPEMHAATVRALTLFVRDHLGRFVPAFARHLQRADGAGAYGALAALLVALVDADGRRLGIARGSQYLGLRPDPATCAAPMGCAAEGDCPVGPAVP